MTKKPKQWPIFSGLYKRFPCTKYFEDSRSTLNQKSIFSKRNKYLGILLLINCFLTHLKKYSKTFCLTSKAFPLIFQSKFLSDFLKYTRKAMIWMYSWKQRHCGNGNKNAFKLKSVWLVAWDMWYFPLPKALTLYCWFQKEFFPRQMENIICFPLTCSVKRIKSLPFSDLGGFNYCKSFGG